MNTCFLAVEGLLSTFQGDDYVHTHKMVVELCIDKKFVLKRECLQNGETSFAYHIHLCVQSTFFIPCLHVPFFCSFWVVDSLLHISSSWFLSPYLRVLKRFSQFHLFLVSLNP
jgi:hypothetical protein